MLVCAAADISQSGDVQNALLDAGTLGTIDLMDCRLQTPTLFDLQAYDSVLLFSDGGCYQDAWMLGNNLADYVDGGGGVVLTPDAPCQGPDGRFMADNYAPLTWGSRNSWGTNMYMFENSPGHPILDNVSLIDGGWDTQYFQNLTIDFTSEIVATWDQNGAPLIATKESGSARVVSLGLYPVSDMYQPGYWPYFGSDTGTLMANALNWSANTAGGSGGVLLCAADDSTAIGDVKSKLDSIGAVSVTTMDCGASTPDVATLSGYDAVMLWEGQGWCYADSWTLGNNLRAYADAGGGVVVHTGFQSCGPPSGDLEGFGYLPLTGGSDTSGPNDMTLVPHDPRHPILAGIDTFSSRRGHRAAGYFLDPQADVIASWSTTSDALVATKITGDARVVTANWHPVSDDLHPDYWDVGTDAPQLMTNQLLWAAGINPNAPDVLLCGAEGNTASLDDLASKLEATGQVASVTSMDCSTTTPSVAQLQSHDAVLVWESSGYCYQDPWQLGNNLRIYADAGGGVVVSPGSNCNHPPQGDFEQLDYAPLEQGFSTGFSGMVLSPVDAGHPILDGVGVVGSGNGGRHNAGMFETPNASIIARWDQSSEPLVATKTTGSARVVTLNMYPLSNDVDFDGWDSSTDGALLIANALGWASGIASANAPTLLLCTVENPDWVQEVKGTLASTGLLGTIDTIDCSNTSPTLAQLQAYDAVMLWENGCLNDSWTVGDNLADYVDGGGGVVLATGSGWCGGPQGRLYMDDYLPLRDGSTSSFTASLQPVEANHPILEDVASFHGSDSIYRTSGQLDSSATVVATWDATGDPLVATKLTGGARVVTLNINPVSETINPGWWDTSSDGARLMANSVLWASNTPAENAPYVMICGADPFGLTDVQSKVLSAGSFAGVTAMNCEQATPSLEQLQGFDAVLVYENGCYSDPWTLGDNLADFADSGGGVVVAPGNGCNPINGRFETDGYAPYDAHFGTTNGPSQGLQRRQLAHEILEGVDTFFDATSQRANVNLRAGADLVASWQQTDDPLVATYVSGAARTVLLNMMPPSGDASPGWWDPNTDGAQLIGNSLLWAAGVPDENAPSVLLCAADWPEYLGDVEAQLGASGIIGDVEVVDCSTSTPSVAQMSAYDAVFVWENGPYGCFYDAWMLGDNLADFADAGGGVVVAPGLSCGGVQGRFVNTEYTPLFGGSNTSGPNMYLNPDQAGHPILDEVTTFYGGISHRIGGASLTSGGETVASWDLTGDPLVATKITSAVARVAYLNLMPPSDNVDPGFWDHTTQGGRLMANALVWAADPPGADDPSVMLCTAAHPTEVLEVTTMLAATGLVGEVTTVDCSQQTPTSAQMQAYDAVVFWDNGYCFQDSWLLGTQAAAYTDAGGGVVTLPGNCSNLDGDWINNGYWAIDPSWSTTTGPSGLGLTADAPAHPILDGIDNFAGGEAHRRSPGIPHPEAKRVATWSSTSDAMVATRTLGAGRTVEVNMTPLRDTIYFAGWNNQGDRLLANAIRWAAALPDPDAPSVMLCASDDPTMTSDVVSQLQGTGMLGIVDLVDCQNETPSFIDFTLYDAVLTWDPFCYADGWTLGDNLADYADTGGGVVMAIGNACNSLNGRMYSGPYMPIRDGSNNNQPNMQLVPAALNHPILAGVDRFDGGNDSVHQGNPQVNPVAQIAATWDNGQPLVGTIEQGAARTVTLNMHPASNQAQFGLWDSATDGARLMANALLWSAHELQQDTGTHALVCGASPSSVRADVRDQIDGTNTFDSVTVMDCETTTPSVSALGQYHAVMAFGDGCYFDAWQLGDNLANYADIGGGVVVADAGSGCGSVDGLLRNNQYIPLTDGTFVSGNQALLVPDLPGHPILSGVGDFDGGADSAHRQGPSVDPQANLVASWTDGEPMVATKLHFGAARVVSLNLFPGSDKVQPGWWDTTTDGAQLMANAMLWAASGEPCFDNDGDSFYDEACGGSDCDDNEVDAQPGNPEVCDGIDNNCDGEIDEGVGTLWYADADGDGYGDPDDSATRCGPTAGWPTPDNTDCNDAHADDHPFAPELCDGVDNDCDGAPMPSELDIDGDGFVECASVPVWRGTPGILGGDCTPTDPDTYPGAPEDCNGVDNDCDGTPDNNLPPPPPADLQQGVCSGAVKECQAGGWGEPNYSAWSADYEPTEATCDTRDNDCDGSVDEGVKTTFYQDSDGDGYGTALVTTSACTAPSGYDADNTDCDDSSSARYPGNPEVCDGLDNDCAGGVPANEIDDDTDGQSECQGDCDDTDASAFVGGSEDCDGADNDCDGTADNNLPPPPNADMQAGVCAGSKKTCSSGAWRNPDYSTYSADYEVVETACDGLDNDCDGVLPDVEIDNDGDAHVECSFSAWKGVPSPAGGDDCDDADATSYPFAPEQCDGADNNCDGTADNNLPPAPSADLQDGVCAGAKKTCGGNAGWVEPDYSAHSALYEVDETTCDTFDNDCDTEIDEGGLSTWYADGDGDGAGDATGGSVIACSQPAGYASSDDDCDDNESTIFPGADELCDGLDNDCDGVVPGDEIDDDADGFVECVFDVNGWDGTVAVTGDQDCDDTDAATYPNAPEQCDRAQTDCTLTGVPADEIDDDGDSETACEGDCDDSEALVNSLASEACDGVDTDCDGTTPATEVDDDGDGYVECVITTWLGTGSPDGGDCDDTWSQVYPGAPELCDGLDNACTGTLPANEIDNDGDNHVECTIDPAGWSGAGNPSGGDCDDAELLAYPGFAEVCDGIDNDCSGGKDNGLTAPPADLQDGVCAGAVKDCGGTLGWVEPNYAFITDYEADETSCDTLDNDCDGDVDEAGQSDWYLDVDGDGWGDSTVATVSACAKPSGYVAQGGDCDDLESEAYPGNPEVCDGIDNNCDTNVDENVLFTFYVDNDGDDVGSGGEITACTRPAGYAATDGDCDDNNAAVTPGKNEVCDGFDNDCNTQVDDGVLLDWYPDADGDGDGDANTAAVQACTDPGGTPVHTNGDCDDNEATVYTGASERCDGLDNNCDGSLLATEVDADGDNKVVCVVDGGGWDGGGTIDGGNDCNDAEATIYPGAPELCDGQVNNCGGNLAAVEVDGDGDGYVDCTIDAGGWDGDPTVTAGGDCNDTVAAISPGAVEVCDGIDNDCDTIADDGVTTTFYRDLDDDGYGSGTPTEACTAPAGYAPSDDDCDDSRANVNPGATEVCDTRDNNCDGTPDEGVTTTYYLDPDGDGYADDTTATSQQACTAPAGHTDMVGDCDESDPNVYPGAGELCDTIDNDCNGTVDDNVAIFDWYLDDDGDGHGDLTTTQKLCSQPTGYVLLGDDCDDSDATRFPGNPEACNSVDNDCDGTADNNGAGTDWYIDGDGDGWGTAATVVTACTQPSGYAGQLGDCDNNDAQISPDAVEVCDGLDNDCSGVADDNAPTAPTWYADVDQDGYGDINTTTTACNQPAGYVADDQDCDDTNFGINPDGTEVCDGADNDCNNNTDEAGGSPWYADTDGDSYGDANVSVVACMAPADHVADDTDCDDADDATYPNAPEACDLVDNDCDGSVDEDAIYVDYYLDADGDGHGDANNTVSDCAPPTGYVALDDDCDDNDPTAAPSQQERIDCDGVDNNCDGQIDENIALNSFWYDGDGDGQGTPSRGTVIACFAPAGDWVLRSLTEDCDDNNNTIYSGATETCNGIDDDCDGTIDDGPQVFDWYQDADTDGYGNEDVSVQACNGQQPSGYVIQALDCDDTRSDIHPDATEIADDGVDNDCDGTELITEPTDSDTDLPTDTDLDDLDGDGFTVEDGDCNDEDPTVYPGADEDGSKVDKDCNGYSDPSDGVLTPRGCGCPTSSHVPGGLGWAFLPLVVFALRRRA